MNDTVGRFRILLQSLGDNSTNYIILMRRWYKMIITRKEFDNEVKKFMTPEQYHLHDQFSLYLLMKCGGLSFPTDETMVNFFGDPFEPLSSFVVSDRRHVEEDQRTFLYHDRVLPDQSFVLKRLHHNAYEFGLEGSTPQSADLLVVATQQFLKNLLTAVVSRRKGCRVNKNKFIHSLTRDIPNPWLKNVARHSPFNYNRLNVDAGKRELLPSLGERPTLDEIENENAFILASSGSTSLLKPISLMDVFMTLTIFPSIIASDMHYKLTRERIISRINHPTYDD